ncbi:MAG: hypothetical protein J4F33_04270 [Alphaproteobacteria bacterium]|nr:hypothetical protein [Alphaproteobacteria bacterium]
MLDLTRADDRMLDLRMDAFEGGTVRKPPPLLGEHNRDVLRDYGFCSDDIAKLESAGAVVGETSAEA